MTSHPDASCAPRGEAVFFLRDCLIPPARVIPRNDPGGRAAGGLRL